MEIIKQHFGYAKRVEFYVLLFFYAQKQGGDYNTQDIITNFFHSRYYCVDTTIIVVVKEDITMMEEKDGIFEITGEYKQAITTLKRVSKEGFYYLSYKYDGILRYEYFIDIANLSQRRGKLANNPHISDFDDGNAIIENNQIIPSYIY